MSSKLFMSECISYLYFMCSWPVELYMKSLSVYEARAPSHKVRIQFKCTYHIMLSSKTSQTHGNWHEFHKNIM